MDAGQLRQRARCVLLSPGLPTTPPPPHAGGGGCPRVGAASLRLSFVAWLAVEDATVFVTGGEGGGTMTDFFLRHEPVCRGRGTTARR
jgi:hypothetical protein